MYSLLFKNQLFVFQTVSKLELVRILRHSVNDKN